MEEDEATEVTTLLPKNAKKKKILFTILVILLIIIIIIVIAVLIWYFVTHKKGGSGENQVFDLPKGFSDSVDALNDPAERRNALLKLLSNLNFNMVSVIYSVGFVYRHEIKQADYYGPLRPAFFYEKITFSDVYPTSDAEKDPMPFLSKEFGVYRNLSSGVIVSSWYNDVTENKTEVFPLQRDPWDFNFTTDSEVLKQPYLVQPDGTVSMITEVSNRYRNPVAPEEFPGYSFSGNPFYTDTEFTRHYGNLTDLVDSKTMTSFPAVGTWFRSSQYLPWMQLGDYPGGLVYVGPTWKIKSNMDIKSDFLDFIKDFNYTNFISKPEEIERPNKDSWNYFNDVILHRNATGKPLVQIPPDNKTSKYNNFQTKPDPSLQKFMTKLKNETIFIKGRTYLTNSSQTSYGKHLANMVGYGLIHNVTHNLGTKLQYYYISLSVVMSWEEPVDLGGTRQIIHKATKRGCLYLGGTGNSHLHGPQWLSRVAGNTLFVASSADRSLDRDSVSNVITFMVDGVDIHESPHFYGSLVRMEKWPEWMKGDQEGQEEPTVTSHLEFVKVEGGLSDIPHDLWAPLQAPFTDREKCSTRQTQK